MLTRFFSHSKPIAFAILGLVFTVAFFFENFVSSSEDINPPFVFGRLGILALFFLIIFLLNFVVKRNKIQHQHTFTVSSFVLLIIAFPQVLRSTEFILGYFFLLLAFRRVLSLKTNTNIKQKILDASILLSISIWFEPAHWLFLVVIYFGIIMYVSQNYRHFIIPILGLSVGFVLHISFVLIMEGRWVHYSTYFPEFKGFSYVFETFKYGVLLSLSLLFLVWVIFQLPIIYSRAKLHESESLSQVLFFMLISILILLLNDTPLAGDIIYLILPLSILIGNYFQLKSTKKWTKESFYLLYIAGIVFSAIY